MKFTSDYYGQFATPAEKLEDLLRDAHDLGVCAEGCRYCIQDQIDAMVEHLEKEGVLSCTLCGEIVPSGDFPLCKPYCKEGVLK